MLRTTLLGLLLTGITAQATNAPVAGLPSAIPAQIESTPAKGVLPARVRTLFGLTIGSASIAQVQEKLGAANVVKLGNIDGRPKAVCYRSASDDTVVVFEAGPLGGFDQVTGVTVASGTAFAPPLRDCATSAKISRALAAAGTLRLGADINAVAGQLKIDPRTNSRGVMELPFEATTLRRVNHSAQKTEVDTSSGIFARVRDRRVIWYHIYFTESM